jgi:hypothetical protein
MVYGGLLATLAPAQTRAGAFYRSAESPVVLYQYMSNAYCRFLPAIYRIVLGNCGFMASSNTFE